MKAIQNSKVFKSKLFIFFALSLIIFIFYGNSLNNGYSIDDHYVYTNNSLALDGLSNVKEIFQSNTFNAGNFQFGYRPISTLSFAFENEIFGVDPFFSHLINILLYCSLCFIIYFLVKSLFPENGVKLAIISTILFLIMPVHSEIVNNVKCRDELLMLNFGFGATYFWLRFNTYKNIFPLLTGLFLLLCSIFSKKTGVIFFPLILLSMLLRRKEVKSFFFSTVLFSSIVIIFMVLKRTIKEESSFRVFNVSENPLYDNIVSVNKFIFSLESFYFYLSKTLFPTELVCYYGFNTINFQHFDFSVLISFIAIFGIILICIRKWKSNQPLVFGLALFVTTIAPFLNILKPVAGIVAERFATIPSFGIAIAIGSVILKMLSTNDKIKAITVFLLILAIGLSYAFIQNRNNEWKNTLTTLEHDVIKEPNSSMIHAMLGASYLNEIEPIQNKSVKRRIGRKSLKHLQKSLEISETNSVLDNLGFLYYRVFNDYEKAEKVFNKILQNDSTFYNAHYNLGRLKLETKDTLRALEYLKECIILKPNIAKPYELILIHLIKQGKLNKALSLNRKGLETGEDKGYFYLNQANILFQMKEYQKALSWYKKASEELPNNYGIKRKIISLTKAN